MPFRIRSVIVIISGIRNFHQSEKTVATELARVIDEIIHFRITLETVFQRNGKIVCGRIIPTGMVIGTVITVERLCDIRTGLE